MSSIGDFQILREIDRGSMGVVYLAQDPDGQHVAIKTFSVSDAGNEKEWDLLRKLLIKEGARTLDLDHPNIVRTLNVVDEDGLTYIVMEYVDGPNLDKYLGAHPLMEPGAALNLLRQAASALDYAASRHGLVHRDVKPANMMITAGGTELKLTDFGIAKRVRDFATASTAGASLSETHRVGTLRYMAPEQITEPTKVDGKADQYGLANVAYRLLTGRQIFEDKTNDTSLGYAIVNTAPPRPSTLNQSLRGKVDKVMSKALAKKPGDRFPTCTAFVDALESAVFSEKTGIPVWARTVAAGVAVAACLTAGIIFLTRPPQRLDPPPCVGSGCVNPPPPPCVGSGCVNPPPPPCVGSGCVNPTPPPCVGSGCVNPPCAGADCGAPPPPPPPEDPKFTFAILANNNPLTSGVAFGADDEKFGRLGKGDLVASVSAGREVPAGTKVTVDWEINGISYSTKDFTSRSFSRRKLAVEYDNTPTSGSYRVRLLVNGKEKQTIDFKINGDS